MCATLVGIIALIISWLLLRPAAELCAVLIRQRWPETWFAGLIVWYADFFALGLAIAIAAILGRYVFRKSSSTKV
jgi:hypothetical protein